MKKKSIGIGLMGLGVVAGQVARVLTDKAASLAEAVGCPVVLRKVTCQDRRRSRCILSFLPPMMMSFFRSPA